MVEKNNFAGADIDAMVIFNDKRESDADFTVTATFVDSSQIIYGGPIHETRGRSVIGYRDEGKKGCSWWRKTCADIVAYSGTKMTLNSASIPKNEDINCGIHSYALTTIAEQSEEQFVSFLLFISRCHYALQVVLDNLFSCRPTIQKPARESLGDEQEVHYSRIQTPRDLEAASVTCNHSPS